MSSLQQRMKEIAAKFDYRKSTEFEGTKFELALLTLQDEKKMNALVGQDVEGLNYFAEMKKTALSYALRKIDDTEIPETLEIEDENGKSSMERSLYVRVFLDKLPSTVIDHLFNVYIDLKEEAEEKYKQGIKYHWFKTPEQRDKETEERIKEDAKKEAELRNIRGEKEDTLNDQISNEDINLRPIADEEDASEKTKTA